MIAPSCPPERRCPDPIETAGAGSAEAPFLRTGTAPRRPRTEARHSPAPLRLAGSAVERTLECRVLQSPLAGVSDRIFRGLVRRWAPEALLFTEMVLAHGLAGERPQGRSLERLEGLTEEAGPVAVQLFDHRPGAMAEAARRAEACGAFLIDINMGCPVPKIARRGGGSGLIRDPDLAARIVDRVASAVGIPVTVKTRLGWGGSEAGREREQAAVTWCRRLEVAGARLITLHGRSREQGFEGRADWQAIAAVKRALAIPVIANGDIRSPEDAHRCLAVTGCDGVMVGRGTLGAPWLVGQISATLEGRPVPATPPPAARLELMTEQLRALLAARGDHGLLIARKHMGWMCRDFRGAEALRRELLRNPDATDTLARLERAAAALRAVPAEPQGSTDGRP